MLLRLFTLVVDVGVAVWRSTAGLRWSGTLASETALAVRLYTTVARLKAVGLPDPPPREERHTPSQVQATSIFLGPAIGDETRVAKQKPGAAGPGLLFGLLRGPSASSSLAEPAIWPGGSSVGSAGGVRGPRGVAD
jgi:hypothetical protein